MVVLPPTLLLLLPFAHNDESFREIGPWAVVVVIIGFLVAEPLVFNIEARNEAVSFSPTDIPLAIGMLLLSPLSLVAARIVGSAILLVIWRRQPLFKFTLNLTGFTAETLIAVTVFRALQDVGADPGPLMWLSLLASLMAGLVVGGVIIATAISFFEHDLSARVRREFSHSYLYYLPGAALATSAAIPVLIEPWLVFAFLLPAPLVWLVLRSHGALMHRFTDLNHVFNFSSQVGRSTHLHEIADTAISEIADQLRAHTVALVVWNEDDGPLRAGRGDSELCEALPGSPGDPLWAPLESTRSRLVDTAALPDPAAARLTDLGMAQVLLATLYGDDEPVGLVLVADRRGAATRFDDDDNARLRNIAEQLGVAVRKAQLHAQIQHDATHDRLTGLPNRPYFEAWSEPVLDSGLRNAALLLLDLDRFKEVNDALGHHAGDDLLVQVAERLASSLADGDVVSRFGGDEFAILVPDAGEHEASLLAETISEALEKPFVLGESTV
ncbi:MAG: diguanylate cyclase domain-containing protein, partial [Acidimicrobiales bacterium]